MVIVHCGKARLSRDLFQSLLRLVTETKGERAADNYNVAVLLIITTKGRLVYVECGMDY